MNNQLRQVGTSTANQFRQVGSTAAAKSKQAIQRTDEFTRDLPPWAKGAIVIGVLFIGWKIYGSITKTIEQSKLNENSRDTKQEVEGWFKEKEVEDSKGGESKASMTNTEMKAMANKLFNLMDGYGTRDYDITQAFKHIKNNADFAGVNAAYGTRTLQPGYGVGWLVDDYRGTLIQSLNNEAASSTLTSVNKTLKNNGIKYRV